jgi:hypothetical protein
MKAGFLANFEIDKLIYGALPIKIFQNLTNINNDRR